MQYNTLAYHRMACIFFAKAGFLCLERLQLELFGKSGAHREFKAESYD